MQVLLITNMPFELLSPEALLELNRSHWHVENKLHYRQDLVFGEDRSTIRKGHGPANMSALRAFAISLLQSLGIGNVKRCVDNLKHDQTALLKAAA